MQFYELVYLLRMSANEKDAEELQANISKLLQDKGAEVEKYGNIGKRKLAYDIDHETHADYWMVQFRVDTQAIADLHRMLTLEGRVLRFLIVAQEPKSEEDIERERVIKERLEKDEMKKRQQVKEEEHKEKIAEEIEKKSKKETPASDAQPKKEEPKEKLSLEELDEKLEELLDDDSLNT